MLFLRNEKYGDGRDGAYAPSTNETDAPIDSACTGTIDTNSLLATNASFQAGQMILIIQMYSTGYGNVEVNVIDDYVSGEITTKYKLAANYVGGAQVIVIPQYHSMNISLARTIVLKQWNGTVGGVYVKACETAPIIAGVLTANSQGFAGGGNTDVSSNSFSDGLSGDGTGGPSVRQNGPQGNGGGGGGYSNNDVWSSGNGGGGGTNTTIGAHGGYGSGGGNGAGGFGIAGNEVGNSELTLICMGGGGGGGGAGGGFGGPHRSGVGGRGAGIVILLCKEAPVITGLIQAIGGQGTPRVQAGGGAGASGGGGSILIITGGRANLGSGLITATGGTRVFFNGSSPGDNDGGEGGTGRIVVRSPYPATGSTNPALVSVVDRTLADQFFGGMI